MSEIKLQFLFDNIKRNHVTGRNCDHVIKVGDVFNCIVAYEPRSYPDFQEEPVVKKLKQIHLKVITIHAYGKQLPELGRGMTATLELEGEIGEFLLENLTLESRV